MDNLGDEYMIGGDGFGYFYEDRDPVVENLMKLQAAR